MKIPGIIITMEVLISPCLSGMEKTDTLHSALQAGYERVLEFSSEDGSVTSMLELLEGMREEPLDLNLASVAELEQIPGLGPMIAHRIVTHRLSRPFQSVKDLAGIQGITPEVMRSVDPFVTVKRRGAPIANRFHIRTRAVRNGIGQSGSGQYPYPGSPEKLYSKLVARFEGSSVDDQDRLIGPLHANSSLAVGFVTEKDPGEKNYLDFVSGHLCASIPAISARILAGDFVFEAGQGLVFWRSSGFSKGSEATAGISRNSIGVRPTFSTDQAWSFRGAAATLELGQATFSAFYSNKAMDATCDSNGIVTRFDVDGLHRTETELEEKNKTREKACGARVTFDLLEGMELGASALAARFDKSVILPGIDGFSGNRSSSFGVDVGLTLSSLRFFGEVAQDYQRSHAGVLGMLLNPCPEAGVAFLARVYPRGFKSFHGAGFSENGQNSVNESGLYCGISLRPIPWLSINAYWDKFSFPWRTSSARFPSKGDEIFARAEANLSRRTSVEVHFRHKDKPSDLSLISAWGLPAVSDARRVQQNFRIALTLRSPESFVWKSRVEVVSVRHSLGRGHETGMLTFQDLSFVPLRHTSVAMRIVAFDTPSFDSRVYEYEEEVPGVSQTPALYGKGFRWYFVGTCELIGGVGVSLKYSQTRRDALRNSALMAGRAAALPDDRLTVQLDVKL